MFTLTDNTKAAIAQSVGLPYEQLVSMDDAAVTAYLENKLGQPLGYPAPRAERLGSGGDSVLLDRGKLRTLATVDKALGALTKRKKAHCTLETGITPAITTDLSK